MASAFSIWIVSPPGYSHSRCFDEVALSLRDAFAELGHDAPIVTNPSEAAGQTIVLGCNLLGAGAQLPRDCILYNLEQVSADSRWLTPALLDLFRRHRVWDYSRANIAGLAQLGVNATLCEIGYMPALSRIAPAAQPDIDVAFIGSMNDRRYDVLEALQKRGKRVFAGFDLYGAERDAIYARAKIAINIHFYQAKVFEIVRCSYLFANRICVVSETGADAEIEAAFKDSAVFAPFEGLADACVRLLDDDAARQRVAEAGFAAFAARPQTPFLRAAISASEAA